MKSIKTLIYLSLILFSTMAFSQANIKSVDVSYVQNRLTNSSSVITDDFSNSLTITLPYDGKTKKQFSIIPSTILSDAVQAQYPDIKTYRIQMKENPEIKGGITVSPQGFFAHYFVDGVMHSIHPLDLKQSSLAYVLEIGVNEDYYKTLAETGQPVCGTSGGNKNKPDTNSGQPPILKTSGSYVDGNGEVIKRKFDMVVATTGEFTTQHGGTAGAMTVITNTVNCVNSMFEKDMAVCLVIVETCIFTDENTDPFIPPATNSRTNDAANAINGCATMPHDIGHVFHYYGGGNPNGWATGGVAGLGVVCNTNTVAGGGQLLDAGWSGSFDNISNGWCQLAAHEFGHMFGAEHTFNGSGASNCDPSISSTNAYEIASGTTIMSYNGICDPAQNIPALGTADNYFHTKSIEQMTNYLAGVSCAEECPTNNTPPVVSADPCGSGVIDIPIGTPFKLQASGTDNNGDPLAYTWEQIDEDGAGTNTQGATLTQTGTNGNTAGNDPLAPLFRSYPPSSDPCRYFPDLNDYSSNVNTVGTEFEVLPQVVRTINFALTARDCNTNGGGTTCDTRTVNVIAGGPLVVNSPCAGGDLTAGQNTTITWNTNGSDAACTTVDILMSTDGGATFPYDLGTASYAAGSASLGIPAGATNSNEVRIQIICNDNPCATFFAMSAANCTLISDCLAVESVLCPEDPITVACGGSTNLALSPLYGEPLTSETLTFAGSTTYVAFNDAETACQDTYFGFNITGVPFVTYSFTTTDAGIYNFSISPFAGGSCPTDFNAINIYSAPFDAANPCNNFVTSSAAGPTTGAPSGGSSLNADLAAKTTYHLTVIAFCSTPASPTTTVSFPSSPEVYDVGSPAAPYDNYTYVAVSQTLGTVTAVHPASDFSGIAEGCYDIYGVNYENDGANATPPTDVDPSTFNGQSVSAILSSGVCINFSTNSVQLCLESCASCIATIDVAGAAGSCDQGANPVDPADDTFTVTATASITDGAGQYIITDGTTTWGPFASGTIGTAGPFTADGATTTGVLTIQDSADNTCSIVLGDFGPVAACPDLPILGSCTDGSISYNDDIQSILVAKCAPCHTTSGTSGFFVNTYAGLIAGGNNCGAGVTSGDASAAASSLIDKTQWVNNGTNATCGNNMPTSGTPLTAAEFQLIEAWITAGAQEACPSLDFTVSITDPCVCNNDQTDNAGATGDGTFTETVVVNDATAGQTYTITAASIPALVGQTLTFNAATMQYETIFNHDDGVGYEVTIEGPGAVGTGTNTTQSIANMCFYPEIALSPALASPYCNDDNMAVTLAVAETNSDNSGAAAFTVDGAAAAGFTPSILGDGTYPIVATWTGTGGAGQAMCAGVPCATLADITTNNAGIAAACDTELTTSITVQACTAPCNATMGTWND